MEPVLTRYVREPNGYTLDFYLKHQGYEGLKKALAMKPGDVIEMVKASGLRGRGGAGFPTGLKWQFVLKDTPLPKYIACNADESEPGTFKDHVLMERNPHLLFEGCLIGCCAIGAKVAYIYIRGEFYHVQKVLEAELAKAYAAGLRRQEHPGHRLRLRHRRSTAAPARTRRARRRRSSSRSKASARSRASSRRFPRCPGSTTARPRSTTSRRSATCPGIVHERRRVVHLARAREERRAEAVSASAAT